MIKSIISRLLILLCCNIATSLFSQDFAYKKYTMQDGLAQQQVTALFEDSRGYIWVSTKGGVSKFNGQEFETFTINDGLLRNTIHEIFEDRLGNIWINTSAGLIKYDGANLQAFPLPEEWAMSRFYTFLDADGDIWLSRINSPNILLFDGGQYHIEYDFKRSIRNHQILDGEDFRFFVDSVGVCTVAGDSLQILEPSPNHVITELYDHQLKARIRTVYDPAIQISQSFILKEKEWTLFYTRDRSSAKFHDINYAVLDNDYYIRRAPNLIIRYRKEQELTDTIVVPTSAVTKLLLDSRNSLWIGTEEGLFQWFGEGVVNYEQEEFQYVWSIVEASDNSYWFARYTHGLSQLKDGGVQRNYNYLTATDSTSGFYFGGLNDRNGNLLFPLDRGVLKMDQYKNFTLLPNLSAYSRKTALYLYEDTIRELLITGTNGGIDVFKDYQHLERIGSEVGLHECGYILAIEQDTVGLYWLGSSSGLSRFNYDSKEVVNYTNENGGLPSPGVISIYQDSRAQIWLGGVDGLMYYNSSQDSIYKLYFENQYYGSANFLTETNNGKLLVGFTDGLLWLDLAIFYEKGQVDYFFMNHNNGYLGIEPTQNTVLNDSKGHVWVASSTMTTKIDPFQLDFTRYPLKAVVISINEERLPYLYWDKETSYVVRDTDLKFTYEAIGYNRPQEAEYSYQLEGFVMEWSPWSDSAAINFSNLASGEYCFKVRARTPGESGILPVTEIKLQIDLPLSDEPYFGTLIGSILASFLLVATVFWWNSNRQSKERLANNALLTGKNEAIEQQNQLLEIRNEEISTLRDDQSHRIKNDLQLLATFLELQAKGLANEDASQALLEAKGRVEAITLGYRQLLSKTTTGNTIGLSDYLRNFIGYLEQTFSTNENAPKLEIEVAVVEIEAEYAVKVGLIIGELVTNSLKYAFLAGQKGVIQVNVQTQEEGITCRYRDNGPGLPKQQDVTKAQSMGLRLIRTFTKQLSGTMKAYSEAGACFDFVFAIPVKK